MGQNFSRRNSESSTRHGNGGEQNYPANQVFQVQYAQSGRGQQNRTQQYLTYPTHYPDPYMYARYGPTPRQLVPSQQPPLNGQQTELQQTKTIRNQVNLKKQTIQIQFRNDEKTKIMPTFTFDASAPCSVTLFFLAKEDVAKGCSLHPSQIAGPRSFYEKGLAQVFPPPGNMELAESHTLDLTKHSEETLTKVTVNKDDLYPLVIRLETVTEKGVLAGHSLTDLEAGSPIPAWVQSQTTYAYLVKEEDGSWEARTVRQKIWVEGISYELQEIYGIQDIYSREKKTTPVGAEKAKDPLASYEDLEGRECTICLSAVRDTTVLPCRHMCMCEACARELQRQQVSKCPICRDPIESLLHIKRPEQKTVEINAEKAQERVEADSREKVANAK